MECMKLLHVLLFLLVISVPAFAQSGGAHVKGRVTDETGGALPGVTVELLGGSEPREVVSDATGNYDFDNVPAGTYQLSMRLINFAAVNHRDLKVSGQTVTNDEVMHLSLNAEVVVVGKRTFTNLADVENPAEDLVGIASSASQGAITAKQLDVRPFMRQAEVLETVPGVIITQHSGEGKANQYFLRGFNLDHGSDFAMTVAGTPVNMPTLAHCQDSIGHWSEWKRAPTTSAGCCSLPRHRSAHATCSPHSKRRPTPGRGLFLTRTGNTTASCATAGATT